MEYSEYNEFNRFVNVSGIEGKILYHLITSETLLMDDFWKLMKYPEKEVLSRPSQYPSLTVSERWQLINDYNNEPNIAEHSRIFLTPFSNESFNDKCSILCIYLENIYPQNHMEATVSVAVEVLTHVDINTIMTDSQVKPVVHPNDSVSVKTGQDNLVVYYKSRQTLLMQLLLSELNGLYIDGVGYLRFNTDKNIDTDGDGGNVRGKADLSLYKKAFYGHKLIFNVSMSGMSSDDQYWEHYFDANNEPYTIKKGKK